MFKVTFWHYDFLPSYQNQAIASYMLLEEIFIRENFMLEDE